MADSIQITAPVLTNPVWAPSPVSAGASVTFSVTITEEVIRTMYPLPFASGEISSGEG